jgi:type I restriction enzyme S subunit
MKTNWQTKRLGDLCDVITKGTTPTSVGFDFVDSGINFIKIESISVTGDFLSDKFAHISQKCNDSLRRSQLKENDILFSIAGALGRTAVVSKDIIPANTNQALAIIRLKSSEEFLRKFILLTLNSGFIIEQIGKAKGGVAQQNLSLAQISNFEIPLPPLPEQHRIVKILDEVFENIKKAKENTEKNLQNSKELFESYLQSVFMNQGKDWEEKRLEECFKLKSGDNITSKVMAENGKFPVYGGNGIAGMYHTFNLSGSNVIIGRVGALCGNVRHMNENIWLTDNGFKITDIQYDFDHDFLTYLLNFKNLRGYARQAAQPVISNSSLKDVLLRFPKSLSEQKSIVAKLDALSSETKKLEGIYKQKLADLEELKKSMLKKAFSGEL